MTVRQWAVPIAVTFVLVLFAACGGGGSSGGSGDDGGGAAAQPGAPNEISDVSRGAIDGFGSVKMNGKEYETGEDFTDVQGDDNPSLSDLQEGMEVEIRGGFDDNGNLTAAEIRIEEAVKGEVTGLNPLTVLHQEIRQGRGLMVDDSANLTVGDEAEVHGNVLPGGIIAATFIEKKLALVAYKVKGVVSNLNVGAQTFELGPTLVVDYSGPGVLDNDLNLANGVFVEVKSEPPAFAGSTLTASRVDNDAIEFGDDVVEVDVEGFVNSGTAADFFIGSQQVQTDGSTEFLGGTAVEVKEGAKLEVEGRPVGGVIQADKVKFKESVRVEGNLVVTDESDVYTIEGLFTIEVEIGDLTEIEDGPAMAGSHVRVRGREVASGSSNRRVLADRLEVRDADTDIELRALVESDDEPPGSESVTLLGVVVGTASLADDDFRGEEDVPIGRPAFYAAVQPGRTVVEAKGDLDRQGLWREVQLEGEDD